MTPKRQPKRGAIYGRQSRTREGSESLDTQVEACQRTAQQHGIEVVETLLEPPSTSAYKNRGRSRPKFPELLRLIESGEIDCIVAYKTDRLSRGGGPGWAPLIEAAEAAGLNLDLFVLIAGNGFMSEFEIGIRATMDREESRKTSERLTDVQVRKAAAGMPSGGGARAYGYERDGITLVPAEAAVTVEIVDRYLAGEGFRSIARSLNERGIVSAAGKTWRAETMQNMLRSPRVAGLRVHHGEIASEEASWPAIIPRTTWERLQAKMRAGSRDPFARKYLLSGLLTCGRCGRRLSGKPESKVDPATGARVEVTYRYACLKRPGTNACGGLSVNGPSIDRLVEQDLFELLDRADVREALSRPDGADTTDEAVRLVVEIEKNLLDLAALHGQRRISMQEWLAAREPLEAELAKHRAAISPDPIRAAVVAIDGNLADEWEDVPLDRKRAIIRYVLEEITVASSTKRGSTRFDPGRIDYPTLRARFGAA